MHKARACLASGVCWRCKVTAHDLCAASTRASYMLHATLQHILYLICCVCIIGKPKAVCAPRVCPADNTARTLYNFMKQNAANIYRDTTYSHSAQRTHTPLTRGQPSGTKTYLSPCVDTSRRTGTTHDARRAQEAAQELHVTMGARRNHAAPSPLQPHALCVSSKCAPKAEVVANIFVAVVVMCVLEKRYGGAPVWIVVLCVVLWHRISSRTTRKREKSNTRR